MEYKKIYSRELDTVFSNIWFNIPVFWQNIYMIKFIYSEKTTIFCETSIVDLSYVIMVNSAMGILQNFVAFSEYMNFSMVLQHLWDIYKNVHNCFGLFVTHYFMNSSFWLKISWKLFESIFTFLLNSILNYWRLLNRPDILLQSPS